DRETGRALSPDDLMLSGSIGKTYVGAAALDLVLAGRLDLDQTVARHFEPDKATTLRAIVLVMAAAGLVRALEHLAHKPATPNVPQDNASSSSSKPQPRIWQRFAAIPLAVPVLVYALIFLFATVISVVPLTSFWGSYQRLQGTYTNLSYIFLFVLIVATLRRRAQLERIITVSLLTGLVVASYGLIQHLQLDPLPWKGDVITRVASTMGNSIFVAAYMILIIPLALYRLISAWHEGQRAPAPTNARADTLWAVASSLLVFGTLALLLATIKFGSLVRAADLRYWWILPGAILVSTTLWMLLTRSTENSTSASDRSTVSIWPGIALGVYIFLWLTTFALSANNGMQAIDSSATRATDWWLWLTAGCVAVLAFYILAFTLPRRSGQLSRFALRLNAMGALLIFVLLLVATFFTQSRGPWIGLGFGLFTFFLLLLRQAIHRAREQGATALATRLRAVLAAWVTLTLLAGSFLIVFNISDAPFFQQLRDVPYLGRMGRLLEVDSGTGLVRRLIWIGDEHAGGAVALIRSDPVRTIVGWGPESMFVVFNRFYPPSLANVEARGASPDRSHQAILDELVTKGLLGLISYFFLLFSAIILCWRMIRRSAEWHWQVFFIACLSIIVSHFAEGLTGIPIVSTLMMFWVTLAFITTGGMLAGHYTFGSVVANAEAGDTEQASSNSPSSAPPVGKRKGGSSSAKRGATARGTAGARARAGAGYRTGRGQTSPAAAAFYIVLSVITLGAVWWFNLNPIYADMRFQQGQAYSGQPNSGLNGLILGMNDYLATIRGNPREDFYYLNLGRTLMNIADRRRAQGTPLGEPNPEAQVNDLLRLQDPAQIQSFVFARSPLEVLSYAETVLHRARDLNPLNKDHYANLGRLNNFWYSWTQDPSRLQESLNWYEQVNEIAPQDVTLMNERAGVTIQLGNYTQTMGSEDEAARYFNAAEQLLQRSKELDQRYVDTDARLADLYRLQGRLAEATDLYVNVIKRSPNQLDSSIERIADSLEAEPDLLRKLRDAYAEQAGDDALLHAIAGLLSVRVGDMEQAVESYDRATTIQPQNVEYHRNFTIVLSDTRRYDQALSEARNTLSLAQSQPGRETEVAQLQALIAYLEQQAAGGE
ncbi:MAG: serine hydrolase, partial [Chloroflexales bacterium]|nr:serine hydrolase [Chloroflexales bacterium]